MSERERWIVYPLLFLALGASLRDKLAKQTRSQQIVCEELFVVNNQGRPVAKLTEGSFILESSKNGPGTIRADVLHTNALIQQGRQIGQIVTWQNLIPIFQQMGLIRVAPNQVVPVIPKPIEELPPEATKDRSQLFSRPKPSSTVDSEGPALVAPAQSEESSSVEALPEN